MASDTQVCLSPEKNLGHEVWCRLLETKSSKEEGEGDITYSPMKFETMDTYGPGFLQ